MAKASLQASWDARLALDGLAPVIPSHDIPSHRLSPARHEEYRAASEYWHAAEEYTETITDTDDRDVWSLHAEGLTAREIDARLPGLTMKASYILKPLIRRFHRWLCIE